MIERQVNIHVSRIYTPNQGPYSREDHLTLGFFRNFKMRNSSNAEFHKSLFSNYLRKTVVAEFRILNFMQNTPFFPRI